MYVTIFSNLQSENYLNKIKKDEFDAGAKYHVAADVPYVKYFTSYVYNFQFYKALCLTAGQYNPNDPKKPLCPCKLLIESDFCR